METEFPRSGIFPPSGMHRERGGERGCNANFYNEVKSHFNSDFVNI